jgi:hypothetical protein
MASSPLPDQRALKAVAWALLALAGAAAVGAAVSRGTWFDEYWSLYLGDPGLASAETWRRWLTDSHPPLPNALYRLVVALAGGDLVRDRLLLNLPPFLALAAATLFFHRRSPSRSLFYLAFALVAVSLPGFAAGFSEFRSYAWQICADAIVLQYAHFLIREDEDAADHTVLAVGGAAIVLATLLHFISGAIMGVAMLLLIADCARRGDRRRLAGLAAPCAIVWIVMIATVAVQLPRVHAALDVNWATTDSARAADLFLRALGTALLVNPVAAWIAARHWRDGRRFAAIMLGAAAISLAALLVLNAIRPTLMARYLFGWELLIAAATTALAVPCLARSRAALALFLGWAGIAILFSAALAARTGGWEATQHSIAAAVRACPATKVYAGSPWRLGPVRASGAAAREHAVFALAYRKLAREAGFAVTVLPDTPATLPLPAPCPTLIWIEHNAPDRPDTILRRAQIGFTAPARLRLNVGATGFVVAASPLAQPPDPR